RQALALVAGLPDDLSRLLRAARRGKLELHVDVTQLRRFGNQLDRAINRLVVGLVIAALIIGSSIVMTVPGGPTLFGLPVFGLAGFAGAVAGSLWLFASLWRSERRDRDTDDGGERPRHSSAAPPSPTAGRGLRPALGAGARVLAGFVGAGVGRRVVLGRGAELLVAAQVR